MTATKADPIPVEIVNHPTPKRYELRGAYRTCVLTAANPYQQIAGPDALRKYITLSGNVNNSLVVCGNISQASDPNNVTLTPTTTTVTPTVNAIPLGANAVASYNNNSVGVNLTIAGGTVTAIAINGTTTGLTSGTFFVPAGGTVTVTYSVAPVTFTTAGIPVTTTVNNVVNPNGRFIPAGPEEWCIEGQQEIWLVAAVYPTVVGYTILREVPET